MTEDEASSDSDSVANNPPPLPGSSIYGSMPPPPADEPDPFAAPSPYQVSPAVADPAAEFEASLAHQEEGVLTLADPGLRFGAFMIDGAIFFLPFILFVLLIDGPSAFDAEPSPLASGVGGFYIFALLITHLVLLSTRGQSLGKMAVGIKIVVHNTGETAGFVNAVLLRGFVGGLPAAVPCIGFIYYIVDCIFIFQNGHRTLHDLIGGTSVIKVPKAPKAADMPA